MKNFIIPALLMLLSACSNNAVDTFTSSPPSIEWQKSLGGSSTDYARSIQQTSDGGYIVAGYSASMDGDVTGNHGGDIWIVKLNSAGSIAVLSPKRRHKTATSPSPEHVNKAVCGC